MTQCCPKRVSNFGDVLGRREDNLRELMGAVIVWDNDSNTYATNIFLG